MAKLPEKFVPGEIYYIDELQTVAIGTSETECILYDASPEIRKQIDDLKNVIIDNEKVIAKAFSYHQSKISQNSSDIEQIPFKKGTGNNSAVLKGTSNSATNKFATAFGEQTTASADRAFSEGLKTTASGANSHAEGLSTVAQGQNSHAEGNKCKAIGNHSHVEGNGNIANGGASHAEGSGTITTNNFEHAEGRYNFSNHEPSGNDWGDNNTIHSVGIGTSNNVRKNAHEILQNGKHYIYGIGGYNGTNVLDLDGETVTAYDLATVINNKAELSDIPQPDWDQNDATVKDYIKNRTHYKNDIVICYNKTINYNEPFIYTLKTLSPIVINWEDSDGIIFETILNESNNYTAVVNGYDCTLDASVDKDALILTVKETYGSSI